MVVVVVMVEIKVTVEVLVHDVVGWFVDELWYGTSRLRDGVRKNLGLGSGCATLIDLRHSLFAPTVSEWGNRIAP